MRILAVTNHPIAPYETGAARYLLSVLEALAGCGWQIDLACLGTVNRDSQPLFLRLPRRVYPLQRLMYEGGVRMGRTVLFPRALACRFPVNRSLRGIPRAPWMREPDRLQIDWLLHQARRTLPQIAIVQYGWLTPVLEALREAIAPAPLGGLLTCDVFFQRARDAAACGAPEWAKISYQREAAWCRSADFVIAMSAQDRDVFKQMASSSHHVVTPMPELAKPDQGEGVPGRCVMLGAASESNRKGLDWFLKGAWEDLRRLSPGVELHLFGGISRQAPDGHPGIVKRGWVKTTMEAYREASVVLLPLLYGSGSKIRLTESLAFGKPIVTTAAGIHGLNEMQAAVAVGSNPAEFAAETARLLSDPALRRLRVLEGRRLLAEFHRPDLACQELAAYLDSKFSRT